MPLIVGELAATLGLDDKPFTRGLGGIEGKATGALKRIGETAAGFITAHAFENVGAAIEGFVNDSIDAASSLNESLNAVNSIFGDSAQTILDWGKQNANSFGLSRRAFNEMATPLGAMLKNSGLSMDQVTGSTIELTKRAADMASVFNTDVSDALAAIQAGLRGEADPLERYGVKLSAAAVDAEALAQSGKTSAAALTDQERALARVSLLMKQTESVAGDFTNTSNEYANAQRIAAARTEEMQAKLGQKLLPVMEKVTQIKLLLVSVLSDKLIPAFEAFSRFIGRHKEIVLALVTAIGVLFAVQKAHAAFMAVEAAGGLIKYLAQMNLVQIATKTWAAVQWVLNAALAANPIVLVVVAIAALVAALVLAWQHSEKFREIVTGAFDAVKAAAEAVFNWVSDNWPLLLAILTGPFGLAALAIVKNWDTIKGAASAAKDWIRDRFDDIVGFVTGMPGRIAAAARGMWDGIVNAFKDALNSVFRVWNSIQVPSVTIGGQDPLGPWGPSIPEVTLGGWKVPQIPYLAEGGMLRARPGGVLARIAEGGEDEVVAPLSRLTAMIDRAANVGASRALATSTSDTPERSGGDVFHFPNYIGDRSELVRTMRYEKARERALAVAPGV